MAPHCKCSCSIRIATFVVTSLELVILTAAFCLLVALSKLSRLDSTIDHVISTTSAFALINIGLSCILIYGTKKKLLNILRGWLWVRVTLLATVVMMVILAQRTDGVDHAHTYPPVVATILIPTALAVANAFVVRYYIVALDAEESQIRGLEMDTQNYSRLRDENIA
nr:uncharacterized protein LOC123774624 [Procambarus clarkii]